jgi:YqxM protein
MKNKYWFTKDEVILIRMKRFKSIRKIKKKSLIILKILSIFYVSVGLMAYLFSTTNASFNDVEEANLLLTAGTWEPEPPEEPEDPPEDEEKGCSENHDGWDCSSLVILESGYEVKEGNGEITIYAKIKNNSENNMTLAEDGKSYLYYIPKGNPKNGVQVAEVLFTEIPARETITLSYTSNDLKPGEYKFVAYQSEGHPGKGVLWSDSISLPEIQQSLKQDQDEKETEQSQTENTEQETVAESNPETNGDDQETEDSQQPEDESQNEESLEVETNSDSNDQEIQPINEDSDNQEIQPINEDSDNQENQSINEDDRQETIQESKDEPTKDQDPL